MNILVTIAGASIITFVVFAILRCFYNEFHYAEALLYVCTAVLSHCSTITHDIRFRSISSLDNTISSSCMDGLVKLDAIFIEVEPFTFYIE